MNVSVAEIDPGPPFDATADAQSLRIVYRPLRGLVPYARNARTHTAEQIKKIEASLSAYGWTNPMLIAGNDMIAGHARLTAAIALAERGEPIKRNADPWLGPTIDLSHLDPNERRAYIIADNRLAEDAGWDRDLLQIDMSELQVAGFDLSLTGFAGLEIDVLLGGGSRPGKEDDADRELTKEEQAVWDRAWCLLMDEWHAQMERTRVDGAYLTTTYTKAALAVSFVRALLFGGEIPRGSTLAYSPSRLWVNAHQFPLSDIFTAAKETASLLESVRWMCQGRPLYDKFLASSLGIHGYRAPNDFPAHLARNLIDEFCPNPGARVLDPCHGWGGRMLGFLLARNATHYHGIDVSPPAQQGLAAMFEDLRPLCHDRDKSVSLDLIPFQEVRLEKDTYDFALTSPPYFNVEKYDGERQSWRDFATFDDWVAGFYKPLIGNTAAALKPGGVFALQVGSQMFPLTRLAKEFAGRLGLEVVAIRQTDMTNSQMGTEAHDGEVVVILRKPDGSTTIAYAEPTRPPGYLDHVEGVYIRKLVSGEEVRKALRVRQAYAGTELRPMPAIVYHTAADEGRMWGAFDAVTNEIIGYATARWRKKDNTCEFQQIGVNENAPKGTGRLLSTARWHYAVDRGATACTLNTLLTSSRARMYHAKFGFTEDRRDNKNIYFRMDLSIPKSE